MHVGYCSTDTCAIFTDIIKSAQELKPKPVVVVACVKIQVSALKNPHRGKFKYCFINAIPDVRIWAASFECQYGLWFFSNI